MTRTTSILTCLVVLIVGVAARHFLMANTDVSWLITVAEKVLDGRRLYVDIVELNPPMSIYLYMPAVLLGRMLAIRPEIALDGLVMALGFVSLLWAGRGLPAVIVGANRFVLLPAAFAIVAILPAMGFGQREQIAFVLFLPWLALAIARAHAMPITRMDSMIAGVAGGLVMAIKPHLALAFAAASFVAAFQTRSWRVIFALENVVAGGIVVAYFLHILLFYPMYGQDLRPILQLYLSVRQSPLRMLFGTFPLLVLELLVIAGFLAATRGRAALSPWVSVSAAAIAGFIVAAVLQGKGWPYHFFPALALLALMLAALTVHEKSTGRPYALLATLAIGVFAQVWWLDSIGVDIAALQQPLRALNKNPRIMVLASDPAVSFPTTRAVGGVWADQAFIGWVTYYAGGQAASEGFDQSRLPVLRELVEANRRKLAADLRGRKLDAILIERKPFDFLEWARRDSEIDELLGCFVDAARTVIGDPDKPGGQGLDVELWKPAKSNGERDACLAKVRAVG
jgi:hypothetical protein